MKKLITLTTLIAALAMCLVACGDTADKNDTGAASDAGKTAGQAATETVKAAGDNLAVARDTYVATADKLLTEVGDQLPSYKEKVAALPGPAKAAAEKTMTTLESAHSGAKETLAKVKDAAPENWQDLKPDMDKALENVSGAFDKVKSLF